MNKNSRILNLVTAQKLLIIFTTRPLCLLKKRQQAPTGQKTRWAPKPIWMALPGRKPYPDTNKQIFTFVSRRKRFESSSCTEYLTCVFGLSQTCLDECQVINLKQDTGNSCYNPFILHSLVIHNYPKKQAVWATAHPSKR